tara:strand:+ start:561 stop:1082 length:522 start_codon:yes stop_codon:yes gene_type:complete
MTGIIKVDTIQNNGGTTGLTIDSSGRILTPARPAFSVYLSSNAATADNTSVGVIPFDAEDFDIGNNVTMSSNAVFTAPIAGIYQFNLSLLLGNCTAANIVNTYFYIDGAQVGSDSDLTYRTIQDPQGGAYQSNTASHLIQLTASQTVTPYFSANDDTTTQVRQGTRFSGFLVG